MRYFREIVYGYLASCCLETRTLLVSDLPEGISLGGTDRVYLLSYVTLGIRLIPLKLLLQVQFSLLTHAPVLGLFRFTTTLLVRLDYVEHLLATTISFHLQLGSLIDFSV